MACTQEPYFLNLFINCCDDSKLKEIIYIYRYIYIKDFMASVHDGMLFFLRNAFRRFHGNAKRLSEASIQRESQASKQ
jgi:hypothetical protein